MNCKICNTINLDELDVIMASEIVGQGHETMCVNCALSINEHNLSHDSIYEYIIGRELDDLVGLVWDVNGNSMNTVWMLSDVSKNFDDVVYKINRILSGIWPESLGFKIHPWPYTEGFMAGLSNATYMNPKTRQAQQNQCC